MSKSMRRNSVLDIYITDICNLNCEYCYVALKKNEKVWFDYNSFVSKVNLNQYDTIRFLWWEPLLKIAEVKRIIEYVYKKNNKIKFVVITNWLLFNEDILQFFNKYNVSIAISVHKKWIKKLFDKEYLITLLKFKDIIWFILLYDNKDITFATKIFLFLAKIWFDTFSLSPINDTNWDKKSLSFLKMELDKVKNYIKYNKNIIISETKNNSLKLLNTNNFCKKSQVNKKWEYKLCTRFDKEYILEDKDNVEKILNLVEKNNNCNICKDRWFCTCFIWYYLDNKWKIGDSELAIQFHNLNKVFINFFKDIVEIKNINNFLAKWINEIRFNLTEQCNLRCNYCYLDFSNKTLDLLKAKNIIDFLFLQDGNEKIISFFWGEPLLEFGKLKELVLYSNNLSRKYWKKISYKIATNWLLLNNLILDFLKENNFEIHLSLNWIKQINDFTRDNSTDKLLSKINLLKWYKNIVILLVIFPKYINKLEESLEFILKLWFKKISFEIYLWEKYSWDREKYLLLDNILINLKNKWFFDKLEVINTKANNRYLDISADWLVNDNSLEFFNKNIDFSPKKELDKILNKLKS